MKLIAPFVAAAALALAGCSSTPARVEGGTIRASTFSYVDTGQKPAPGYAENRAAIHSVIQGAISRSLASRGLNQVATGGEITVAYLIITGNNASTAMINDYFGYGDDATALQSKAHDAYTGSKNPNYFEAGTLVIDLIDSKTFKLLKRGYATRQILRDIPDDARAARIQEVTEEILRDVRVAR